MLPQLYNLILSQAITPDVRNNISQIHQLSMRFDGVYQSFRKALNDDQRVFISNNLDKLEEFFSSETGRGIASMFAEEFEKSTKA